MIEDKIAEVFEERDHRWNIGGELVVPTSEDISIAMDEVAKILHTADVGDRLDMGGLIFDKTPNGYDVYVYLGNYQ